MARPPARLRYPAGASLLALLVGMSAAMAQTSTAPVLPSTAVATAADALGGLRRSVSDAAASPTQPEDLGDPESFGEPAALGEGETMPERPVLRDGDADSGLRPALEEPEPPDPDAARSLDGDLAADGQPDEIVEAPEEDADAAAANAPSIAGAALTEPAATEETDEAATADGAAEAAAIAPEAEATEDSAGLPSVEPDLRPAYDDEDPYAPLGIRVGSFLVFPEISLEQWFDDNVLRTETDKVADRAVAIRPSLRIVSDWSRHSLEASVSGLRSYYQELELEDDRDLDAALHGRLDISSDTILDGTLGYLFYQESRGTIDFPANAVDRPNVTDKAAGLALTQRFNRLGVRVRGAGIDSRRSGEGLDASEDYLERELGFRVGYEVSPGFYVFAEHEISRRDYAAPVEADGLLRDADGHETRAGVAADITSRIVGELSVGQISETPDADALAPIKGLVADGSLTWTPSALTTVNLGLLTSIAPTTIEGSAGALEHTADLSVRHEFRRYFAAVAGLGYTARDYAGTDIEEDELDARFGLEYLIGREWVLGAQYQRTQYWSSEPDGDYSDDLFRITGTWRR